MSLTRRDFSAGLVGTGMAGLLAAPPLAAQPGPVEDVHYIRLAQPAPVTPGQIEVVEFFWYECPHCNAFEPALEAWAKRQPDDVAFRRVPVWFRESHSPRSRALPASRAGILPPLHRRIYHAIPRPDRRRNDDGMVPRDAKRRRRGKFMADTTRFSAIEGRRRRRPRKDRPVRRWACGRFYTNGTLPCGICAGAPARTTGC